MTTQQKHNVKIVGDWDGEVIWRRKTSEELMSEAFAEMEENRKKHEQ